MNLKLHIDLYNFEANASFSIGKFPSVMRTDFIDDRMPYCTNIIKHLQPTNSMNRPTCRIGHPKICIFHEVH